MIFQRSTSASGAPQVGPARKGWVPMPTIVPSAVGASPSAFTQNLSSRPEGRALCGPQRRDRGTNSPTHPDPSFRAERPDFFFRAGLWRVGSRSRGISLLTVIQTFLSVLLGSPPNAAQTHGLEGAPSFAPFAKGGLLRPNATTPLLFSWVSLAVAAAAFRGGRLLPSLVGPMILQQPTSAGGAQEASPAREGWVQSEIFDRSAVGAARATRNQNLSSRPEARASCGPQPRDRGTTPSARPNPSFRVERPDLFFRAGLWRVGSRSRGISLLPSWVSLLCDLCVSVSLSFCTLRFLRVLCASALSFSFFQASTFDFHLSTPEPITP